MTEIFCTTGTWRDDKLECNISTVSSGLRLVDALMFRQNSGGSVVDHFMSDGYSSFQARDVRCFIGKNKSNGRGYMVCRPTKEKDLLKEDMRRYEVEEEFE